MKRGFRLVVLAVVALVGAFFAVRLWNGGTWAEAVTRNPEAYPATGRMFAPWVKQYFFSALFLFVGAVVTMTMRPKEWRKALEPWLVGGALLTLLAAIGVAASPVLRIYATARDENGHAMHQRLTAKNVPLFLGEAAILAAAVVVLRRQDRRRSRTDLS